MYFSILVAGLLTATTAATPLAIRYANATPTTTSLGSALPTVDLGYALHQGTINETAGYYNFSNIRYAQSPVGDLRFAAPQPPLTNRTLDDGQVGRICYQALPAWEAIAEPFLTAYLTGKNISNYMNLSTIPAGMAPAQDPRSTEDCLFLDVIVPQKVFTINSSAPVIVWIYGGGYTDGEKAGNDQPTDLLAKSQNVTGSEGAVFVAMNYRLGAFGWLSGPSFQANGTANVGLYDQRFALEWVQTNIHLFGGDPKRVTVIGESAGGGSIMHQITAYGGSQGPAPFAQAILQSPGFFPVVSYADQEAVFQNFLNLTKTSSLAELRQAPIETLVAINIITVAEAPYGLFTYGPAVDGDFVPALPGLLLKHGQYDTNVTIMTGHNADEGLLFTPPNIQQASQFPDFLDSHFLGITADAVSYINNTLYPGNFNGSLGYTNQIQRTAASIADAVFVCNTVFLLEAFGVNQSHAYLFDIQPALHGEDVAYTFDNGPGEDSIMQPVNTTIAATLQEYIVNFAATGNPNGPGVPTFNPYGEGMNVQALTSKGVSGTMDPVVKARCDWWQLGLYA